MTETTTLFDDPHWPRAGRWPGADALAASDRVDVAVIGVPTWRTSLSATGAHATPAAVRAAIQRYGTFADGGAWPSVVDFGDVAEPDGDGEVDAIEAVRAAASRSSLVVAIGGDNALTYSVAHGAWAGRIGDAGLITIDAHHDLRDGVSNGSPVRRLLADGLDGRRVAQLGIADFANSAFYDERARDAGIRIVRRDEFEATGLQQIATEALAVAGASGGPIHVDVDVDACDRAVAPACPASVPGGLSAYQLRRTVRLLARDPRVTSLDIAEVDATRDASDGRTVRLAALVVLEAIAGFAERPVATED
ncbi:arginase family protein [Humibacter ginsenosidimutans]|uniref:Formimidoylglutamase n=1 Tax=Humibacter ginsenosidimutans TaxID=2599293 RepID=A0A5B8M2Y9_9MICO|nr:arginase family protein [Humibacter ginsenosidimutans]QDZ14713.1 formimidoylglutamase [Humibacter ginsenosidimutans]